MKSAEPVQSESHHGAFLPTLEMITDNMSDLIRVTDLQGVNLYASPSHERILGYKPEDRVGKSGFELLHPDDAERINGVFFKGFVNRKPIKVEYRVRHAEGHYVWLETVGDLLRDDRGEALAVIMSSRDITDRKREEEIRRETEERYRELVEHASDIVFQTDHAGYFTFVNPAALRLIGYEEKEMIGNHYLTFIRPDMRSEAMRFFGRQFVKRIPNTYYEYPVMTKDGREVWLGENTQLIVRDGEVVAFQSVARDISDRKKMEKALRESESSFYNLFQQMNSGVAIYEAVDGGRDFIFRDFNRAAERMERIEKEELLGRRVTEVFPGIRDYGLLDVFRRVWHTGHPEDHDISLYRDSRISGWRKNHIYKLPSGEIVAIYEDVTEQKQAEEMLRESETKLKAIFDTVRTGILIIDQETQIILEANQTAMEMIGLPKERIISQVCHSLVCPTDVGKCPIKDLGQSIDHSERKLLCADGHLKDILKTVYPITLKGRDCYIESFIDISERKRAEEALKDSEHKYRLVVENAEEAILIAQDGMLQYANPMTSGLLGYSVEELVSKPFIEIT